MRLSLVFKAVPTRDTPLNLKVSNTYFTQFLPGYFIQGKVNIIGNGVVIDPVIFKREVDALLKMGVDINKNLFISRKAHLILPTHRMLDVASEAIKGKAKIGSTLKGIGPAYMDKTGRNGLRVGDIEHSNFQHPDMMLW